MSWFLAKTALLAALLVLQCARGADDDYTAFVYAGCSQARYAPGTEYAADVDTALSSLTDSAGSTPYAKYTSPSTTQLAGLYQCRSDLPAAVCGVCAKAAVTKLSSLCNSAAGGAVQLRACFVRYGNDSFLGKQDTTVLFKKCGADADAGGVAASLDTALAALQSGSGSFRAGAAGNVQAMAQCVGDLGDKACSECVAAAASQLKAGCGKASAGEAYLGKCYARFWSGSNAAPGNDNGGGVGNGVSGGDGGAGAGGTVVGGGGNGVGVVGGAGPGNGYPYGFVPRTTYGDVSGKHPTYRHYSCLICFHLL